MFLATMCAVHVISFILDRRRPNI